MQIQRFNDGGFVIHKISGPFTGRVSAWFDRDGRVLDAEQMIGFGVGSRPVKANGPIWRHLQIIGRVWRMPAQISA